LDWMSLGPVTIIFLAAYLMNISNSCCQKN